MRHKGELLLLFVLSTLLAGLGIYWIETMPKIRIQPSVFGRDIFERVRMYQFYGSWVDPLGDIKESFPSIVNTKGRAWMDIQHSQNPGQILLGKEPLKEVD